MMLLSYTKNQTTPTLILSNPDNQVNKQDEEIFSVIRIKTKGS